MKKTNIIFFTFIILISACNPSDQPHKKEADLSSVKPIKTIDFNNGSTPDFFTVTTTDGSKFKSEDLKGKYWLIFVYDKRYLAKSETFDMVTELNNIISLYNDKIPIIGIIEGFSDDEIALKKMLDNTQLNIRQIDNTQGPGKEKVLNDNIFCTPAKILIDPEGKVIHNGCGGNFEPLYEMMDKLIKNNKL